MVLSSLLKKQDLKAMKELGILQICMCSRDKALLWKESMPRMTRVKDLFIRTSYILQKLLPLQNQKQEQGDLQMLFEDKELGEIGEKSLNSAMNVAMH